MRPSIQKCRLFYLLLEHVLINCIQIYVGLCLCRVLQKSMVAIRGGGASSVAHMISQAG